MVVMEIIMEWRRMERDLIVVIWQCSVFSVVSSTAAWSRE